MFYGDATRLDLLRTAGAESAKILVIAVDSVDQSLAIADLAREHFPHLSIVARARDVTHWYKLRDRGITLVERELFESSLRSGRSVMELLGYAHHEARRAALRFRHHNLALIDKMHPLYRDRGKAIAAIKVSRQQFEDQMAQERAEHEQRTGPPQGWGQ